MWPPHQSVFLLLSPGTILRRFVSPGKGNSGVFAPSGIVAAALWASLGEPQWTVLETYLYVTIRTKRKEISSWSRAKGLQTFLWQNKLFIHSCSSRQMWIRSVFFFYRKKLLCFIWMFFLTIRADQRPLCCWFLLSLWLLVSCKVRFSRMGQHSINLCHGLQQWHERSWQVSHRPETRIETLNMNIEHQLTPDIYGQVFYNS